MEVVKRFSPLFLITTHVGRFGESFFCESFGLEFFLMCRKHKDVPTPKISCEEKIPSIFGKVSKLAVVKHFL